MFLSVTPEAEERANVLAKRKADMVWKATSDITAFLNCYAEWFVRYRNIEASQEFRRSPLTPRRHVVVFH